MPRTPGLEGVYPNHLFWRSEWGLSRGHCRTGPGSRHGLGASLGHDRSRIPAMASSQGDVRPSPMAYPAVRPLPKLPLPLRPETGPTS
eukprot:scaffold53716_cov67-Phaeocystis_antarctica.AAC.5